MKKKGMILAGCLLIIAVTVGLVLKFSFSVKTVPYYLSKDNKMMVDLKEFVSKVGGRYTFNSVNKCITIATLNGDIYKMVEGSDKVLAPYGIVNMHDKIIINNTKKYIAADVIASILGYNVKRSGNDCEIIQHDGWIPQKMGTVHK